MYKDKLDGKNNFLFSLKITRKDFMVLFHTGRIVLPSESSKSHSIPRDPKGNFLTHTLSLFLSLPLFLFSPLFTLHLLFTSQFLSLSLSLSLSFLFFSSLSPFYYFVDTFLVIFQRKEIFYTSLKATKNFHLCITQ